MADLNVGFKQCLNCFLTHEGFCLRNIIICDLCKEPFDKNQKAEHFEEFHVKVKCECGESIEKIYLEAHKAELCRKRQAKCFYCDLSLDFHKLQEHMDFCGSRTELCTKCKKYVQIKYQLKHESTNCAYPQSKQSANQSSMLKSQKKELVSKNPSISSKEKETKNENSDLIPCEFCNNFFDVDKFVEHQLNCYMNQNETDPYEETLLNDLMRNCRTQETIPSVMDFAFPGNFNAHDNNNDHNDHNDDDDSDKELDSFKNLISSKEKSKSNRNRNYSNKIPCEICDELVDFDSIIEHQSECDYKANVLDGARPRMAQVLTEYEINDRIKKTPIIKASPNLKIDYGLKRTTNRQKSPQPPPASLLPTNNLINLLSDDDDDDSDDNNSRAGPSQKTIKNEIQRMTFSTTNSQSKTPIKKYESSTHRSSQTNFEPSLPSRVIRTSQTSHKLNLASSKPIASLQTKSSSVSSNLFSTSHTQTRSRMDMNRSSPKTDTSNILLANGSKISSLPRTRSNSRTIGVKSTTSNKSITKKT